MYRIPFNRVDWITSSFLIGTALTALIGVPIYLVKVGLDWFQFAMFFFFVTATMMSITVGYHRLFSHLSFKAKIPVKFFTLVFGACAFENSCLNWASDHRLHHKHVDHDEDPYDISKGFFWAHIGWLIFKLNPEQPMDNVADLRKDKLVMWQHKYVHWIGLFVGLVIPTALGYVWNLKMGLDPWLAALWWPPRCSPVRKNGSATASPPWSETLPGFRKRLVYKTPAADHLPVRVPTNPPPHLISKGAWRRRLSVGS